MEGIKSAYIGFDPTADSLHIETKSSSGDKYETGRSMMQLEIEKYSSQLNDGLKLKKALSQIDISKKYAEVMTGSLVITNQGNYFVSISAGKLIINGSEFFAISYSSPIGQALYNKQKKDKVVFRGKTIIIEEII